MQEPSTEPDAQNGDAGLAESPRPTLSTAAVFWLLATTSLAAKPAASILRITLLPNLGTLHVRFGEFVSTKALWWLSNLASGALESFALAAFLSATLWIAWSGIGLRSKAFQGSMLLALLSAAEMLAVWVAARWFSGMSSESFVAHLPMFPLFLVRNAALFLAILLLLQHLHLWQGWTLLHHDRPRNRNRRQITIRALFTSTTAVAVIFSLSQGASALDSIVPDDFLYGRPRGSLPAVLIHAATALPLALLIAFVAAADRERRHTAWALALLVPAALELVIRTAQLKYEEGLEYSVSTAVWVVSGRLAGTTLGLVLLCVLVLRAFSRAGYPLERLPRRT